jgi:hypothetical protein
VRSTIFLTLKQYSMHSLKFLSCHSIIPGSFDRESDIRLRFILGSVHSHEIRQMEDDAFKPKVRYNRTQIVHDYRVEIPRAALRKPILICRPCELDHTRRTVSISLAIKKMDFLRSRYGASTRSPPLGLFKSESRITNDLVVVGIYVY